MRWDHWWGMGLMGVFWIAVLVAIVLVVVWLFRSGSRLTPPTSHEPSAEEIVKQRYARGEIDKDEYERLLDDIRR